MADNVKKITFYEDPKIRCENPFYNAINMARHWYESNKEFIKIVSGIYNVLEDTSEEFKDSEEYRKDIVLTYTGEPKYINTGVTYNLKVIYSPKYPLISGVFGKETSSEEKFPVLNN